MKRSVLIFNCASEHYYVTHFIKALVSRGLCVYVFNSEAYPQHTPLSTDISEHGNVDEGYLTVQRYRSDESSESVILDISTVQVALWLRPSGKFSITEEFSGPARTFAFKEASAALTSIASVIPARWINAHVPQEVIVANKARQQVTAARAGFRVPYTRITNDVNSILSFPKVDGDGCVMVKTIAPFMSLEPAVIYTQRVSVDELASDPSIVSCPVYVQEAIPKKFEYRVYVVGDEVLACRIDSQASERTRNDWREYDHDNVAHTHVTLPFMVRRRLRRCLRTLDLRYGAVDLIETPEGEFVFLEVNSAGQHRWITVLAGLPIPEAFARMCVKMSREWWEPNRWLPQQWQ